MNGTLVASLVALYSVIVMTVMQLGVKTLLEQLPFMRPTTSQLHDAVLRLVVISLNAILIVATALTTHAFTGLQWYDLLALTFGQSVISHGVFTVASTAPAPPAPGAPSGVFSSLPPLPSAVASAIASTSPVPSPASSLPRAARFPTLADMPQPTNTGPIPVFKPSNTTTHSTNPAAAAVSAQVAADVRANWIGDTPHDTATWPASATAREEPDAAAPSSGATSEEHDS